MPEIYRLARWWATRYRWICEKYGYVDYADLVQAAVVGILKAAQTHDPSKGTLGTWSSFFIKTEIRDLIGPRRRPLPPSVRSLNTPVGEEEDLELIDLLPDEAAPDPQDYSDLQAQVREAVERLKDHQERDVVTRNRLDGETFRSIAESLGESITRVQTIESKARKHLSKDRKLRELAELEGYINYIAHTGPRTFNTTHTSDVERIVIMRDELLRQAQ